MLSFFYLVLICYFIFISFMMINILEKLYDFLVQTQNPPEEPVNEVENENENENSSLIELPDLVVEALHNNEQANCSICTESMTSNLTATQCGHLFHTNCLQQWMEHAPGRNDTIRCPICRTNITSGEQTAIRQRRNNRPGQAQVELTTFSRVFNMDEIRELLENL